MTKQTYNLKVTKEQLQTIFHAVTVHQDVTIDSLGEADEEQYDMCMKEIAHCAITLYDADYALRNWEAAPWKRFEDSSVKFTNQEAELLNHCLMDLIEINDEAMCKEEDEETKTEWSVNRFCLERILEKLAQ